MFNRDTKAATRTAAVFLTGDTLSNLAMDVRKGRCGISAQLETWTRWVVGRTAGQTPAVAHVYEQVEVAV